MKPTLTQLLAALALTAAALPALAEEVVVGIPARNEQLISRCSTPIPATPGCRSNFITDKEGPADGAAEAEGKNTPGGCPADVGSGTCGRHRKKACCPDPLEKPAGPMCRPTCATPTTNGSGRVGARAHDGLRTPAR